MSQKKFNVKHVYVMNDFGPVDEFDTITLTPFTEYIIHNDIDVTGFKIFSINTTLTSADENKMYTLFWRKTYDPFSVFYSLKTVMNNIQLSVPSVSKWKLQ